MKTYKHTVQYYETDKMGVTHHSNYIRFMEEARVSFLRSIGYSYEKMEEQGIISPVVSVLCDYKKPTTFADEIEISVSVLKLTRARLTLSYTMISGDAVVCVAQSSHCFLSPNGRPMNIQKNCPQFYEVLCKLCDESDK